MNTHCDKTPIGDTPTRCDLGNGVLHSRLCRRPDGYYELSGQIQLHDGTWHDVPNPECGCWFHFKQNALAIQPIPA